MVRTLVVAAVAAAATLMGACGNASEPVTTDDASAPTDRPATSVSADGVYEVGVDVMPGIYAAKGDACVGYTASSRAYNIDDDTPPDAMLSIASRVGGAQRIVLHEGEFFTSRYCGDWRREDDGESAVPDPATPVGACEILLDGDHLAERVLTLLRSPASEQDERLGEELQDRLAAVVDAHTKGLWKPAGEMIDFLDVPAAWVREGKLDYRVTQTLAEVREVCRRY